MSGCFGCQRRARALRHCRWSRRKSLFLSVGTIAGRGICLPERTFTCMDELAAIATGTLVQKSVRELSGNGPGPFSERDAVVPRSRVDARGFCHLPRFGDRSLRLACRGGGRQLFVPSASG